MATRSVTYRVLIASPSDLAEERQAVTEVVHEWNAQHAAAESIVLLPIKWETHATPQTGVRPQKAINQQLVCNSDILIGLFWTRLGTNTGEAESGTVEEINQFVASEKPAMLYFSSRPVDPNQIDPGQHEKLLNFKAATYKNALIGQFNTVAQLREVLLRDLVRCIRELADQNIQGAKEAPTEPSQISTPSLSVVSPKLWRYRLRWIPWIIASCALLFAAKVMLDHPNGDNQQPLSARDLLLVSYRNKPEYDFVEQLISNRLQEINDKELTLGPEEALNQAEKAMSMTHHGDRVFAIDYGVPLSTWRVPPSTGDAKKNQLFKAAIDKGCGSLPSEIKPGDYSSYLTANLNTAKDSKNKVAICRIFIMPDEKSRECPSIRVQIKAINSVIDVQKAAGIGVKKITHELFTRVSGGNDPDSYQAGVFFESKNTLFYEQHRRIRGDQIISWDLSKTRIKHWMHDFKTLSDLVTAEEGPGKDLGCWP